MPQLIFLVSQPRAGSTLLQRLLGGHSDIHTTAEPWLMLHPIYALRAEGHTAEYNALLANTALQDFLATLPTGQAAYDEALRRMALHLYERACQGTGKTHFLDKTPRYYHILPELGRIFPEARFLLLLRNPLAVLASQLETNVRGHWLLLARYRHDLLTAPRRLLEGQAILGERALTLHYEDLVTEPRAALERACAHLGLPFEEGMLTYGEHAPPQGRMGDPRNIHRHARPSRASLDKWRRLAHHRQTRHFAEAYLKALGDDTLHALGYPPDALRAALESIPCTEGRLEVTWEQIFQPDEAMQKRLALVELAVLEHRRLVHTWQRWREKRRRRR
ncbi:MAG: hypothetical protein Fur0018_20860 [Anaerolineales bacterium]